MDNGMEQFNDVGSGEVQGSGSGGTSWDFDLLGPSFKDEREESPSNPSLSLVWSSDTPPPTASGGEGNARHPVRIENNTIDEVIGNLEVHDSFFAVDAKVLECEPELRNGADFASRKEEEVVPQRWEPETREEGAPESVLEGEPDKRNGRDTKPSSSQSPRSRRPRAPRILTPEMQEAKRMARVLSNRQSYRKFAEKKKKEKVELEERISKEIIENVSLKTHISNMMNVAERVSNTLPEENPTREELVRVMTWMNQISDDDDAG